jgi:transcriptional regulator with XRE-family HTH domain
MLHTVAYTEYDDATLRSREEETIMGEILAKLRKLRGWTQAETARKLGISRSYYGLIEIGERKGLNVALRISLLFDVPVDVLLRAAPGSAGIHTGDEDSAAVAGESAGSGAAFGAGRVRGDAARSASDGGVITCAGGSA